MVAHTGAQGRAGRPSLTAGRVRPLNRPRPVRVEADEDGRPVAVWLSGRRYAVEAVLATWRIDDEWWRPRPVSRMYFRLLLEDGRLMTMYRDRAGRWLMQTYQKGA